MIFYRINVINNAVIHDEEVKQYSNQARTTR
jgi:hypothetical protein